LMHENWDANSMYTTYKLVATWWIM
jgi:hypothetical protein